MSPVAFGAAPFTASATAPSGCTAKPSACQKFHHPRRRRIRIAAQADGRVRGPPLFKDKTNPKPGPLFSVLSLARNTQLSLAQTVTDQFPQYSEISHRFPPFAAAYAKKKREQNVVDYDDLLELWPAPQRRPRGRATFCPALPPRPRRRVSGHQHAPGPDRRQTRRPPPRDGRRRRRPVHLLMARRRLRKYHDVP